MFQDMNVKKLSQKWINFLRTDTFFYIIAGTFFISAIWLVFTARYPMAFDENYHYNIIQQYAKQWSPFFTTQPQGSEALGDITRYPSYLFHYVLSFPYKFISLFTSSDAFKIIILRLINVCMLASSLWIFKRLFEKMKFSALLTNLSLLVFILIPIVPFLGAQISYDNLTIPLTALTFYAAVSVLMPLRKGIFNSNWLLIFVITGMFNALIKYTYLPIFIALFVYVFIAFLHSYRKYRFKVLETFKHNVVKLPRLKQILVICALLLGAILCFERYGVNLIKYKTPVPDCAQVLNETSCKQYGPWGRDFILKQRKDGDVPNWRIADYNKIWIRTTLNEFYFAINYDYSSKPPLRILYGFAKTMLAIGLLAVVVFIKRILKEPNLRLILATSVFYTIILWLDNYMKFYNVHWPVAIHGRYLLPLVPAIAIVMGYAIKSVIELIPKQFQETMKFISVSVLILGMVLGGGTITYIARSDTGWYWQNNFVIHANEFIKNGLTKVLK